MKAYCLSCQHSWNTRMGRSPRQCAKCWGRSVVSEDELHLVAPVLNLMEAALEKDLDRVMIFISLMARLNNREERVRLIRLAKEQPADILN